MKVRLLRDAKIKHKAGEIVEVSPAEANFLLSIRSAEEFKEEPPKTATKPRKTTKK